MLLAAGFFGFSLLSEQLGLKTRFDLNSPPADKAEISTGMLGEAEAEALSDFLL
jgi:hypothetical protein